MAPYELDGLRLITIASEALGGRGDASLWLGAAESETPRGLVLLLHGVHGSHWSWSLCGGAHRSLERLIREGVVPPLALVMPSDGMWGDGSAYVRHHGRDYGRWIVEEVVEAALRIAGLGPAAPVFIAGNSMGGYGALRLAARHPHRFRAISAHSPVTRFSDFALFANRMPRSVDVEESGLDLIDALGSDGAALPPFRFDCGIDDDLLAANRLLHAQLSANAIQHTYEEGEGAHDWAFWSQRLSSTYRWFARHL